MGRVKEVLKKAHVNDLYWGVMTTPTMRAVRHTVHAAAKDHLFNRVLPAAYNSRVNEPVDEKKILFIEDRVNRLSSSYQLIFHELKKHYDYDIHVHYLDEIGGSKKQYINRCKKMLRDAATAKYIFLNDASNVISCIDKRPETKVVQLWHACGAFKRFGMSTADSLFGLNAEDTRRHPFYRNLDYVTVSSPEVIWAYAEAMDLKGREDIIRPVGVSRTDIFFSDKFKNHAREHLYELFPAAREKKVILFAPTFRGRVAAAETATAFDPQVLADALKEDYVLITKHHPYVKQLPAIPENLKGSFMYDATGDMTIEELLCVSDICISDYSSLIYEYSLFGRPMLFFAYDLEDYFDWRGFYYNYDDLTPGPVLRTNEELAEWILHVDERFDPTVVEEFRERFMSACDGHATRRIMEMVFGREKLRNRRKKQS